VSRRVFVIVGSKGGSGATTLAFELIKRLGAPGGRVLVDGDLGGRRSHAVSFDVARKLDDNRSPGMPGVTALPDMDLVELTNSYEDGFVVKSDEVETIIGNLPADARYVVDAPQPFAAALRPFVTRALRFILVVEPTLLGVSAARQLLAAMNRFGIPPARTVIVLNSRDGTYDLKRNEIAEALRTTVLADVPTRKDRNYGKTLQSLAEMLQKLPHLEPLPDLRPSASIPTGDRRIVPRTGLPSANVALVAAPAPSAVEPRISVAGSGSAAALRETLKSEIHATMMTRIDFAAAARMFTDAQKMAELNAQVNELASELVSERRDLGSVEEASRMKQEIVAEALGLGPIEGFMHDPTITEVMVNGAKEIYVERRGKIELTPNRFVDDRQVRLVIERVLAPLGRRIDESSPMVDARLPDGSRVNATIPPLSIDGPTLTIRRFGSRRLGFDDLLASGSLTGSIVDFLRASVQARLNVVVSGGTGSGKTTLLNALSSFIPRTDRIITIEDAAELLLVQPHVIRLESRPANLEGRGEIRIRECVRNALRMRPDRIVVGECRGEEALDMLQAMNTGHDGSLTTIHANTPRDALSRVETMVMMAGLDLPMRAIREQVSSAFDVVVQVSRMSDGSRKITSVSEIIGMEGDVVTMQELVRYRQRGIEADGTVVGSFESVGVQPFALKRFGELGIEFDPASFGPSTTAKPAWSAR
jgi:pilus assembly protein CpaF